MAATVGLVAAVTTLVAGASPVPPPLSDTIAGHAAGDSLAPSPVELPKDEAAHAGYVLEWWQYWSHLRTSTGHRYGTTITFFHIPAGTAPAGEMRRTDLRITDVTGKSFHQSSVYSGEPVAVTPNRYHLRAAGQQADGGGGHDSWRIALDGYVFALSSKDLKSAVPLFGPSGFYAPDPAESARLYERQRMPTTGYVTTHGQRLPIKGTTWLEHGWVNMPSIATINWDYFQLELRDGRDVEVAQVRRAVGAPVYLVQGQVRMPTGAVHYLKPDDIQIRATGQWRRDASCSYPSGWVITVLNEKFVVTPTARDQEVRSPILSVWDGETDVRGASGKLIGQGIAEPLNYCPAPPGGVLPG